MTIPRGGLPEITCVPHDADVIVSEAVASMEAHLGTTLSTADPRRLMALALCQPVVQTRILADAAAKQMYLTYAQGQFIDQIGHNLDCERPGAKPATAIVRFTRSVADTSAVIPAGTLLAGGDLQWVADEITFGVGELLSGEVVATCQTAGAIGNGVRIGGINTIVTPDTIMATVESVNVSHGGTDVMDDEAYVELIRMRTDAYSCAGPTGAYKYYALNANPAVQDVHVFVVSPAVLDIYVLKTGGVIPANDDPVLIDVLEACSKDTVRPCGDFVTVKPPEAVEYMLVVDYYLTHETVAARGEQAVHDAIQQAVLSYVEWQSAKIGRDINPDELTRRMMEAGAKRLFVRAPAFMSVTETGVASLQGGIQLAFGGYEDE